MRPQLQQASACSNLYKVSVVFFMDESDAKNRGLTFRISLANPVVKTVNSEPCTVLTLPALTSAAITLPATTW